MSLPVGPLSASSAVAGFGSEFAAGGVVHNLRPRFIGFAESNGIGVARTAIAAEGFVGQLRHVRAAHDDRHSGGTDGVRHAIRLGDHAGHGTDAHESNVVIADILRDAIFVHGLGVAIDQQDFMAGRRQGFEQNIQRCGMKLRVTPLSGL